MNIGIFYGSTGGSTEAVARLIRKHLGGKEAAALIDVASLADAQSMLDYDLLLWGCPTYGDGELQDDWDLLEARLDDIDLRGKVVAIFGLGDQEGYAYEFVDAIGILHERALERGADTIGHWPDEGYDFEASRAAIEDSLFCGLAIDEDNQGELTEDRVLRWCAQILEEAKHLLD